MKKILITTVASVTNSHLLHYTKLIGQLANIGHELKIGKSALFIHILFNTKCLGLIN